MTLDVGTFTAAVPLSGTYSVGTAVFVVLLATSDGDGTGSIYKIECTWLCCSWIWCSRIIFILMIYCPRYGERLWGNDKWRQGENGKELHRCVIGYDTLW